MALGLTALISSCSKDYNVEQEKLSQEMSSEFPAQFSGVGVPGVAYVRIHEDCLEELSKLTFGSGEVALSSLPSALSATLQSIGATGMERLFPFNERFAERHHREGLDLWYIIRFDEKRDLNTCLSTLSGNKSFGVVEKVYPTVSFASKNQAPLYTPAIKPMLSPDDIKKQLKFNDPELYRQWHYKNFGNVAGSVAGADAGVLDAWEKETGKNHVIVAIVDGGVDVTHEDLADNMWKNTKEIAGNNIDDDKNGYIDDIYGFNFCTGKAELTWDHCGHGTHVAGTIGARNNNNIGVCGVAGGNGSKESGVRMMSCQIFQQNPNQPKKDTGGDSPAAIVYGADNGAVISQNSWGYIYEANVTAIPLSLKTAIDYFIKYAGCDNKGNQLPGSPMRGGVVIFAAGNDDKEYESYPGAYPPVIAVSSMAPNWKRASYTNRGTWVDIMAPGGDGYGEGQVYSTVHYKSNDFLGKKYGYMAGTSMACPHVSGIAALIVSHYGKEGFTNKELEQRLLGALNPTHNVDLINKGEETKLGRGYVDASRIFAENKNKKPGNVITLDAKVGYVDMDITWKAVSDEDDITPMEYKVFISDQKFTEATAGSVNNHFVMNATGYLVGHELSYYIGNLKDNHPYYIGIQAVDRWGLKSDLVVKEFKTKKNDPPVFADVPAKLIRVSGSDVARFKLKISDPNGHRIDAKISGELRGVSESVGDDYISIAIRAIAPVGKHKINILLEDELGATAAVEIPFEVYVYEQPALSSAIGAQILGLDEATRIMETAKMFHYDAMQPVTFKVDSSDKSVLTADVDTSGKQVTLKAHKIGTTTVNVTLEDGIGEPVTSSFTVHVVPNSKAPVYLIYPSPVKDVLHILVNPEMGKTEISLRNMMGEQVFNKMYSISQTGLVKLRMKSYAPGSYTLQVKGSKGSYTKTFVKI